jgi:phosphatidylglycerol:prolipoprotein diacylglycerol transferase
MRLTPYGLCAAVGLVAAMSLAGRAGRKVGLTSDSLWDTGLAAILSCFAASRLLLVLSDPKAFLRYPVLVLSLPSLTIAGMALAALGMLVYLRRKRLPLLRVLDAFAPAAAALAACLELGHLLDDSEPGIPTSLPWGVRDFVNADGRKVHPVALYGVLVSIVLAVFLWRRLSSQGPSGHVTALALLLGGAAAFGLNMLMQPSLLFTNWVLEPGQCVALGAMLAGAALWTVRSIELPSRHAAGETTPRVYPLRTEAH